MFEVVETLFVCFKVEVTSAKLYHTVCKTKGTYSFLDMMISAPKKQFSRLNAADHYVLLSLFIFVCRGAKSFLFVCLFVFNLF